MKIDTQKLTFYGSLNHIVGVQYTEEGELELLNYMPRRKEVAKFEVSLEEGKRQIEETIERMKIAIERFEEFLAGTSSSVVYWALEEEPW